MDSTVCERRGMLRVWEVWCQLNVIYRRIRGFPCRNSPRVSSHFVMWSDFRWVEFSGEFRKIYIQRSSWIKIWDMCSVNVQVTESYVRVLVYNVVSCATSTEQCIVDKNKPKEQKSSKSRQHIFWISFDETSLTNLVHTLSGKFFSNPTFVGFQSRVSRFIFFKKIIIKLTLNWIVSLSCNLSLFCPGIRKFS